MGYTIGAWLGFLVLVTCMLALDLGVFHRTSRTVKFREALGWSIVWVTIACCFGLGIRHFAGGDEALDFFTGYLIEYSLSMDNIFVFMLIFSYFEIPLQYQHRVLFWGVLGAVLLRGMIIVAGTAVVHEYRWILYFFGAFLVFSGYKIATAGMESIKPETNPFVRLAKRKLPVSQIVAGPQFFFRTPSGWVATPLFLVLLMVETSDVIFAVDSIPAIFAVTTEPFIVFTANIFAVLGLRSMYFLLAALIPRFRYLKAGLSIILTFVGGKMLLVDFYKVATEVSLLVIVLCIGGSVAASLLTEKKPHA